METTMPPPPLDPMMDKQLMGHRKSITALYYHVNDQQVASSSLDNNVFLWQIRGTKRSQKFRGHDDAVMDVTFSTDGRYMASASRDTTVRLWVPSVIGSTGAFKASVKTVRSVQFNPDGTKILTASEDKVVKLWSARNNKFITSFTGHTNWVRCARMSGDGSIIASCSDDKTIRLWNPDSGELIHTYNVEKAHGMHLAWHPVNYYFAIGTTAGKVKLFDIRTHKLVQHYDIHTDVVNQVAFHPSGSYVITASSDGTSKVLDLLEGYRVMTLSTGHTGSVNAVNFSHSGDMFAMAGDDNLVSLWTTAFTELSDSKENVKQKTNMPTGPNAACSGRVEEKTQGARPWYRCYHSNRYPVTTFVHIDDVNVSYDDDETPRSGQNQSPRESSPDNPSFWSSHLHRSCFPDQPNANSTMTSPNPKTDMSRSRNTYSGTSRRASSSTPFVEIHEYNNADSSQCSNENCNSPDCDCSSDVGHSSHIPRVPPKPATYTIPSIKSVVQNSTSHSAKHLFGMVKLKEHDVCYTNGTIEWVGRKRSFPMNSGFKTLDDLNIPVKRTKESTALKDCDCADVLPAVNAIVDHLNALHEAVDIVDLRLNTLEDVMSKCD